MKAAVLQIVGVLVLAVAAGLVARALALFVIAVALIVFGVLEELKS